MSQLGRMHYLILAIELNNSMLFLPYNRYLWHQYNIFELAIIYLIF